MKSEMMAQLLVPGDIIRQDRRKYIVSSVKTIGNETSVLYTRPGKDDIHHLAKFKNNEFLTVINDGRF
jgi:hypothetical protein